MFQDPTPSSRRDSSEDEVSNPQTEMARHRAASADAWRGYVEAGAIMHRQQALLLDARNRDLESEIFLSRQREARAVEEIERLAGRNQYLETLVALLNERKEQAELPSLRQALKLHLRRTKAGRTAYSLWSYARLLKPVRSEPKILRPKVIHEVKAVASNRSAIKSATASAVSPRTRKALLLVTTEGTDMPYGRFLLDLIDALKEERQIWVLHMGEGPLIDRFEGAADNFVSLPAARFDYSLARDQIKDLLVAAGGFELAIVAGKESRSVLPPLTEAYVPSLALLHESDAYATSVFTFQEIFFWATHTCFTSPVALDQAKRICVYLNPHAASALTPGPGKRSTPLLTREDAPAHTALRHRLGLDAERPPDAVVVGWGALSHDNGVDLFVTCADMLRRKHPGKDYRFVWLAQPDLTQRDPAYAITVHTQIKRLGLLEQVIIVQEPHSLSIPVTLPDLILLPTRSEPLQHNGPEALSQGVPLLTFAETSSVAHALKARGFTQSCLARPDDILDLAAKAAALLEAPVLRAELASRLRTSDWSTLFIEDYAQALLKKADELQAQVAQERKDENLLSDLGRLQPDYMGEIVRYHGELDCSIARLYVRGWKAGLGARKPRPGVQPQVYADARMGGNSMEDPYAHYLRAGAPEGPWRNPVIQPAGSVPLPGPEFAVALHIHAYYPDMLAEILERLARNRTRPDLFISVKDAQSRAEAEALLIDYPGKVQAIEIVPNRGRDIGPFLTTFGARLVEGYALVGHLHTKRSTHADRSVIEMWRNFLMENVLGGTESGAMLDNIVCRMSENPSWGIAFPDDPVPLGWDANKQCAVALASRMNLQELPDQFCFPAGTMFWIRASVLQPFVDLKLQYEDYPIEPLPIDGTLLHAMERLFGVVPRALGMECALTSVPGLSR